MKKIIFITILTLIIPFIALATNSQDSDTYHEFATVDTAPGADGYGTVAVYPHRIRKSSQYHQVWFSIGGSGSMTVTLQFKRDGETTWSDYDTYTGTEYKLLEAGTSGEQWRAIVKNGAHSSGSKTFGFTW